jgi:hypothetical protein
MNNCIETANRLSTVSKQRQQPLLQNIDWQDKLDLTRWAMSPELISLYGTEFYEALSDEEKKQLSLLESINFFSLNIHGERHLVSGIMQRIHREQEPEISQYLHHFVDEENKHMAFFAEFCHRYAGFIYPERGIVLPRDYEPGESDFLFFAKALIFEELVDAFNARMAKDNDLHPVVQQINELHHLDESRHRAFGRQMVVNIFEQWRDCWSVEKLDEIRQHLVAYLDESWKSFYNPDVYRDLGCSEPLVLREQAINSKHSHQLRLKMSAGILQFLYQHNILVEEIVL